MRNKLAPATSATRAQEAKMERRGYLASNGNASAATMSPAKTMQEVREFATRYTYTRETRHKVTTLPLCLSTLRYQ